MISPLSLKDCHHTHKGKAPFEDVHTHTKGIIEYVCVVAEAVKE